MSMPTLTAGDFDDFEFELMVADFNEPTDEPVDGTVTPPARHRRPSRQVEQTEAINESLGIYRHRTGERRA